MLGIKVYATISGLFLSEHDLGTGNPNRSQIAHQQNTAHSELMLTKTMVTHKATATLLLRCCLNLKMSHLIVLGSSNEF